MNKHIQLAFILSLLTLAACATQPEPTATPEPPAATTLVVTGSGTVTAILTALADDFAAAVPGYQLEVLTGSGTGGGVQGILEGTLDFAAMARQPNEEEVEQGVQYVSLGIGPVAFFAHEDVDVTDLTTEQLMGIFSGEITNWSEVGGTDQTMVVFTRDEDEASNVAVREAVFGDMPFPEDVVQVLTSQSDMQAAVEGTEGGIGFGTWPAVLALDPAVNALSLNGVAPTDADYPMVGEYGIGYVADKTETVQPLLDWLQTEEARGLLQSFALTLPE